MPISSKLKKHLDDHHVKYVAIVHSRAYTAQEVAASIHVKGNEIAKTVMVKVGREDVMAVLPASRRISFEELSRVLAHADVRLATENEFARLFPECEPGAMPPFGNLYGMRVLCDASLTADEDIVFNAGSHAECIRMALDDYLRLENPEVATFTHTAG